MLVIYMALPLGLSAQITKTNYQEYIGKSIFFNPQKPWHESYSIGEKNIGNLRTHGVVIQNIIVQNNKITVILQDSQNGRLFPISSMTGEVLLSNLSIDPYTENTKVSTEENSKQALSLKLNDTIASFFMGYDITPQKIQNVKWADGGFAGGIQLIEALSPYFALGVEVSANNFSSANNRSTISLGGLPITATDKFSVSAVQFALASRLTVNPEKAVRVYIPFGVGIQSSRVKYDGHAQQGMYIQQISRSFRDSATAYYVGIGIEDETTDHIIYGLEARYHSFKFSENEIMNKTFHPHYYTVAVKVGLKF